MKEQGKQFIVLGSVIGLALLAGGLANAEPLARECVIADRVCFVMRVNDGPLSPEQRIDCVNDRLAYILGHEKLRPRSIQAVRLPNGDAKIRVGRSLLTHVTREDAAANGAPSAYALARIWLASLRSALPQAAPKRWPLNSRPTRQATGKHPSALRTTS